LIQITKTQYLQYQSEITDFLVQVKEMGCYVYHVDESLLVPVSGVYHSVSASLWWVSTFCCVQDDFVFNIMCLKLCLNKIKINYMCYDCVIYYFQWMLLYLLFKLIVIDFNEVILKHIKIYFINIKSLMKQIRRTGRTQDGLILLCPHLITPIINQLYKQKRP
jgi:hypothetical protein